MCKTKMNIYKLLRTEEKDKLGRPAILLKYIGKESLVWMGTTKFKTQELEVPLEITFNKNRSYFYNSGILKVKTKDLSNDWIKDNEIKKPYTLTSIQERKIISKISQFTNQVDPYQYIQQLEETIAKGPFEMIKKLNETIKFQQDKNYVIAQKLNKETIKNKKLEEELETKTKEIENQNKKPKIPIKNLTNKITKSENLQNENDFLQAENQELENEKKQNIAIETKTKKQATMIANLNNQLKQIKQEKENLKLENQALKNNQKILKSENELIKSQPKNQKSSDYERE